jgi:type IV secretion system protein TrbJ
MKRPNFSIVSALMLASVTSAILPSPAAAIVVYDPTNHAQNVLQAARALQQINQQITQLQNEAQMLVNQARNLTRLPFSALEQLQSQIAQTRTLMQQAQRIAYNVQSIDAAFEASYREARMSLSDKALLTAAKTRWHNSVAAFEDALKTQATVIGNMDGNAGTMAALVTRSQSATGALQVAQAGNQLLALQAQQLADLTAVVASQGRAQSLEAAQRAAAQDQAREQRRRFLAPGTRYRAGNARMFGN